MEDFAVRQGKRSAGDPRAPKWPKPQKEGARTRGKAWSLVRAEAPGESMDEIVFRLAF
jgi:hypothetical protein